MPFFKSGDGARIYYNYLNRGSSMPLLVFIHGWLVNWTCFKGEIEYFKDKGYPVLYFDLIGHGKSGKPKDEGVYSLASMERHLHCLLEKFDAKDVVLVGHSLGGMVALLYNLDHNDKVSKSILIDTSYRSPLFFSKAFFFSKHKGIAKSLCANAAKIRLSNDKFIDFSTMKKTNDYLIFLKALFSVPFASSFPVLRSMLEYDVHDRLSEIRNPVLLISSKDDQFFKERLAGSFAKRMKYAMIRIKHGTHSIIIKQPEDISSEMERFIVS